MCTTAKREDAEGSLNDQATSLMKKEIITSTKEGNGDFSGGETLPEKGAWGEGD